MVEVRLSSSDHNLKVAVKGHALFDLKGKDIVCSSVSALLQCWHLSEKSLCGASVEAEQTSGFFQAELTDYNEPQKLLFDSLALGILTIEHNYPKNIKVIWEAPHGRCKYSEKR